MRRPRTRMSRPSAWRRSGTPRRPCAGRAMWPRADAVARLARVAERLPVPYALRVEAARAWASAGGSLGRTPESEIDLLRAPASVTPTAVDRPMFVEARMAAAQRTPDIATRVTLL